jgi:hypothetical protein
MDWLVESKTGRFLLKFKEVKLTFSDLNLDCIRAVPSISFLC